MAFQLISVDEPGLNLCKVWTRQTFYEHSC